MPLIECPDCGNPVSDVAVACPKCGYPVHRNLVKDSLVRRSESIADYVKKKGKSLSFFTFYIIAFVLFAILLFVLSKIFG